MKHSIYIVLSLVMGLTGCSSQKKLEPMPPFVLGKATCQEWIGGQEESGSGFQLMIPIEEKMITDIAFKEVFFRGRVLESSIKNKDGKAFVVCNYVNQKTEKPDIIMHSDATKEVGNQAPKLKSKAGNNFPFELQEDEAVLSYVENNSKKAKYVKISGVKDKPARIYPGRPKN